METLNLTLPGDVKAKLKKEAQARKLTVADLVMEALATRPVEPIFPDTPAESRWRKKGRKTK